MAAAETPAIAGTGRASQLDTRIPETAGKETNEAMEALQLAGQLIMENGGETYRAEETIRRMGAGFGLDRVEGFAVPSGLFISYQEGGREIRTSVKRVHHGSTNLFRVDEVNRVSRLAAAGKLTPAEALAQLRAVCAKQGPFSGFRSLFAAALCAGGFALLFGGGVPEIAVSAAVAALVQALSLFMTRVHMSWMASNILGGLLTALLPALAVLLLPHLRTEAAIAGALMPLVPGIAMTNAVQDTMRGDMLSGLSHGIEALLTACLIAGGALLAPSILRLLTGGGL